MVRTTNPGAPGGDGGSGIGTRSAGPLAGRPVGKHMTFGPVRPERPARRFAREARPFRSRGWPGRRRRGAMTLTSPVKPGALVTADMLDLVPPVVRRYLDWSGIEGQAIPATVCLRETGRLRSANDKPWMEFAAEEDYITDPPAFSWRARVRAGGLPLVRAW